MISVTVPSFDSRPLEMLLDSEAEAVVLLPRKDVRWASLGIGYPRERTVSTAHGELRCKAWQDRLRWGNFNENSVEMMMCEGATAEKMDNRGSLPTRIFKRILISHTGSYVIVNPVSVKLSQGSQEIASISRSAR